MTETFSTHTSLDEFDRDWLAEHLAHERREASVLSEIREAVFGAQDGLTSVLAVVSTVGGATNNRPEFLGGSAAWNHASGDVAL